MSKIEDMGIFLSINNHNERCYKVLIFSQNNGLFQTFLLHSRKQKYQVYDLFNFSCDYHEPYNYRNLRIYPEESFAAKILLDDFLISICNSLVAILIPLLMEKGICVVIYKNMQNLLFSLETSLINILMNYMSILLSLLDFMGFRIDPNCCALSGISQTYYLSPKTASCISKDLGQKYADKLFIIPKCLKIYNEDPKDLINALNIVHYFIAKIFRDSGLNNRLDNVNYFRERLLSLLRKMEGRDGRGGS